MPKTRKCLALLLLLCLLLPLLSACLGAEDRASIQLLSLTCAVGAPLPEAKDFVKELPNGWTARFAQEYSYSSLGEYTLQLILTDSRGNESEHEVNFSLILDEEPPEIVGAKDLSALVGDGVSYRNGVTVRDNCDGAVTLTVDSSQVDNTTEGSYPVIYTATDAAGNASVVEIRVYFYLEQVTEAMLYTEIDRIIAERIPSYLSREQQVREVYDYVYYHISYSDSSDKSDWVRAAYEGIRTGQGDCYTYFALSKAFFARLGIENMDIQRTAGIVEERHYWNFVNVGTTQNPLWYHYDATRLSGIQHSGCLLTDLQVQAYTKQRVDSDGQGNYFYVYDTTKYPESAATIITDTPALEGYY